MKPGLVLHPRTEEQVTQYVLRPSHAVLLTGADGVGKGTLAKYMAQQVLELSEHQAAVAIKHIEPDERGTIPIEAIRELQHFVQLKTTGKQTYRRAVIVEHAQGMTGEAQNAFLKLLEEPPADTIIVMTVGNQRALLPTILSRLQTIAIYPPAEAAAKAHFGALSKDEAAINQAFFLSGGLPGLMHALLADDETHPLAAGVALAKEILQKPLFERLALVEGLSKQKEEAGYVLAALQHIAQTGLSQAAKKDDQARVRQWHHILKVGAGAADALGQNANPKLVLDSLMLRI